FYQIIPLNISQGAEAQMRLADIYYSLGLSQHNAKVALETAQPFHEKALQTYQALGVDIKEDSEIAAATVNSNTTVTDIHLKTGDDQTTNTSITQNADDIKAKAELQHEYNFYRMIIRDRQRLIKEKNPSQKVE